VNLFPWDTDTVLGIERYVFFYNFHLSPLLVKTLSTAKAEAILVPTAKASANSRASASLTATAPVPAVNKHTSRYRNLPNFYC